MPKIKIDKELYEKAKHVSETQGYSSVQEFVAHILEKIVDKQAPGETDDDLLKRLQGLGYIS
jgi:metal-responsive CopG/Arc/MetJ family transcriptional regulator